MKILKAQHPINPKYMKILNNIQSFKYGVLVWVAWLATMGSAEGQIGPMNVCPGALTNYTAFDDPCFSNFQWQLFPSDLGIIVQNGTNQPSVLWTAVVMSSGQLCVTSYDDCAGISNPLTCITITVQPIPEATEYHEICSGGIVTCAGITFVQDTGPDGDDVILQSWLGCDSIVNCVIVENPNPTFGLGLVHLDCDESISICGVTYSEPDPFVVHVCENASWHGCDSIVFAEIQKEPASLSNAGPDQSLNCIETQITLAGDGDTGPEYQITWNTSNGNILSGQNTLTPIINAPGEYCLTVERTATGCSTTDCMTVFAKPQLTINLPSLFCEGDLTEQATLSTAYMQPPFTLNWSVNGVVQAPLVATQLPISWDVPASQAIDFMAWMDFGNGCESDTFSQIIGIANAMAEIEVLLDGCTADSLAATLTGNYTAPPQFIWNDGSTSRNIDVTGIGIYAVTITDVNGCTWQATETVQSLYDATCAVISGRVTDDLNLNCLFEPNENGLAGWLVVAEGDHDFFATTTADGNYSLPVFPGDYTLKLTPPNALWEICSNGIPVSLSISGSTLVQDFLAKKKVLCPKLNVDITNAIMRRCLPNTYVVKYCNEGTGDATDAYVEVQMDARAIYTSSTIPGNPLGNNLWRFEIGDVPVGACGTFYLHFSLDCVAALGESICGNAEIFPHDDCLPPPPNWSGGSVDVEVLCTDSVRFTVTNKGVAPTTLPTGFVVIEDAVLYKFGDIDLLQPGESIQLAVPANGSTWWVEVAQEPNHPQPSQPIAFLEGCGTNQSGGKSRGFVNRLPLGDPEPWIDEDCNVATGSFDPNDKQGFPLGYATEHFIKKNIALEYLIRFQNTGTDTAFTVVVRDTLAPSLDLTALRPGASSHPYEYEVYGEGILQFTFRDIMLPDSNVNEPGSHGFISFEVPQKSDLQPLTIIENKAGIYFDFNDPVITNKTMHTIERLKVFSTENITLCSGEEWNGATYESDTTFVVVYSMADVDSFVQVNIGVLPQKINHLIADICQGETYLFNNQILVKPGLYTAIYPAMNGCDSTVYLDLKQHLNATTTLASQICQGGSIVFNGETLTEPGDYNITLQTVQGCDSIVNLSLDVWPVYDLVQSAQICNGSTYSFNGQALGQAGTYMAHLVSMHGCDSTITLDLEEVTSFDLQVSVGICEGSSYLFDGQELTQPGTYHAAFQSIGGCDSLVALNLNLLPHAAAELEAAICEGDTLLFFGSPLTKPGMYEHTLMASNGCDSTVTLTMSHLPNAHQEVEVGICEGESYIFGGDTLTIAGNYEHVFSALNGCDSVVNLQLTIEEPDVTEIMLEVAEGTTINGIPILSDTTWSVVLVGNNGCDSLVLTHFTVLPNAASEANTDFRFNVFPNPASGYFLVGIVLEKPNQVQLQVHDILGRLVHDSLVMDLPKGEHLLKVIAVDWSSGGYTVQLRMKNGIIVKRVQVN